MLTSSGGVPVSVCVVPAAPVCIRMAAPLPSFTSTHDFSLKVRRSVVAGVALGAVDSVAPDAAAAVDGATLDALSVFSVGAGPVLACSSGLGNAVVDWAAAVG